MTKIKTGEASVNRRPTKTLEEKMDERRRQILHAAEALIRRDVATGFSMKELAAEAGFSLATSYNLIGTKPIVLYSLLNSSVKELSRLSISKEGEKCSQETLLQMVRNTARFFTDDPEFYQPLIRFLEGVPDPINRPIFMRNALGFWRSISEGFEEACPNQSPFTIEQKAHLMHMSFLGGLNLWVHHEIKGEDFGQCLEMAAISIYQLKS